MDNTPFALAINYEGKKALVILQSVANPLNYVYAVKFPNGDVIEINSYDPEEDHLTGWAINGKESELAKEIGSAIDEKDFRGNAYIEPFATTVNGKDYLIIPEVNADEDGSELYYGVYEDGLFRFYITKESSGNNWNADQKGMYIHIDEELVEGIGAAIDEHYQLV
jgi:hypothetical protein